MAMIWVAWPVSPGTCQFMVYTLVAESALEKPEFETWANDHETFLEVVMDEDRARVESLQNGAGSRTFIPGSLNAAEGPIHHYLNAYLDKMQPHVT